MRNVFAARRVLFVGLLLLLSLTSHGAPIAYVANYGSGNVSVINTDTDTVMRTVVVGSGPSGVAVNPAGTRVYVTNRNSNTVSVIDVAMQAVVATVPVGQDPYAVAINPSGTRAYVANFGSNNVSVMDTATNTVIATVAVSGRPNGVAVNPSSTRVYVTTSQIFSSGTSGVSVIDTASNTVTATIPGRYASDVAINPAGTRAYVPDDNYSGVLVIDTQSNAIVTTVNLSGIHSGVTINTAGTRAYVTHSSLNNLAVINTATNTIAATVPVGSFPADVAINAAGTKAYVTNYDSHSVSVINLATNTVTTTIPAGGLSPSGLAMVPDPPRLANISTRGQVMTGNDVMIAGFIVGGLAPKTVVVTVAGPSLAAAGITNPLANPMLTLVRQSDGAVIGTNDNWQSAANAPAIQVAGFAPANTLEPAIMATLAPGAYTAIVQGVGGTGTGLVGVYEADGPGVPLINISTRGLVFTGNDVMIAGFIVQGSGTQSVVVTVAGPSLANAGIPNPLANPMVTIVRASDGVVIATNDNWQTQTNPGDVALIQNAGFAPANALEPAVFMTLPPGAYTAVVQGVSNGMGVALVGAYVVPQ